MAAQPTAAQERAAALRIARDFGTDALVCIDLARTTTDREEADYYAETAATFARWAWRAAADSEPRAVTARLGLN